MAVFYETGIGTKASGEIIRRYLSFAMIHSNNIVGIMGIFGGDDG